MLQSDAIWTGIILLKLISVTIYVYRNLFIFKERNGCKNNFDDVK
jgi:hypothetical protein